MGLSSPLRGDGAALHTSARPRAACGYQVSRARRVCFDVLSRPPFSANLPKQAGWPRAFCGRRHERMSNQSYLGHRAEHVQLDACSLVSYTMALWQYNYSSGPPPGFFGPPAPWPPLPREPPPTHPPPPLPRRTTPQPSPPGDENVRAGQNRGSKNGATVTNLIDLDDPPLEAGSQAVHGGEQQTRRG